jgi:hypothetical protein
MDEPILTSSQPRQPGAFHPFPPVAGDFFVCGIPGEVLEEAEELEEGLEKDEGEGEKKEESEPKQWVFNR